MKIMFTFVESLAFSNLHNYRIDGAVKLTNKVKWLREKIL